MLYIPGVDSLLELDEDLTISNLLKLGMQSLVEAQCEAVLSELLNISPFDLYKNLDTSISNEIAREYWLRISLIVLNSVFNKSKSDIINMINFCGNIFMINDNVLTPHLQTQEITYAAIGYIKELFSQEKQLSSLDMCCGCGAIGLSIKSAIPQTDMTAVDISGRSYLGFDMPLRAKKVGDFDTELVEEFWLGFVRKANILYRYNLTHFG